MKHFYNKNVGKVIGVAMKINFFIALLISGSLQINAQVSAYGFTALTGTYTPLVGATSTSNGATDDDNMSGNNPIGFPFVFNGITYNNFRTSSNGQLVFGTAGTQSAGNDLATTTASYRPGLAPLWDDLQCTQGIKYLLSGSAPNRILTVEWASMEWNYQSNTGVISFQVMLYETTNHIDFIYRQEATAYNAGFSGGASIGIMGATSSDFKSLQDVSASPVVSSATSKNDIGAKPATGQIYRWVILPATPPTPTQDPSPITCATGTQLDVVGTPATNVVWYWQSTATGTSTAIPYAGPYTVFSNGTYYLRALDTAVNAWSTASSSIVISNVPIATDPAVPSADVNPSCITTGSTLSVAAANVGSTNYWQGTNASGTSMANDAASTYNAPATGTYYVRAYDNTSLCWSNPTSIAITVQTIVPTAPTTAVSSFNICSAITTFDINAIGGPSSTNLGTQVTSLGTNLSNPGTLTVPVVVPALPANAIVTSAFLTLSNVNSIGGSYRSEIRIALSGIATLAPTQISTLASSGLISPDPVINLTGLPSIGGTLNLLISETYDDAGDDATFGAVTLTINYSLPSSLNWYDLSSAGTILGTGSTFDCVGNSVLASPTTNGTYSFFAASLDGACESATRTEIVVNVNDVAVTLSALPVTCNNGIDGSFQLDAQQCGNAPLTFAVDGGAFGGIPTNLTVGNHTIVVKDAGGLLSTTYTITVGNALAPTAPVVNTYSNDMIDVSWVANGSETAWHVEWGVPGFTPGTGTEVGSATATDTNYVVTGLDGSTAYDVYVSADCGAGSVPGSWIMVNQTTTCDPIVAQGYCESFEDIPSLGCWSVWNLNLDADTWGIQNNPIYSNTGNNSAQMYTDFNAGNNNDWLVLPKMTLTGNEIMNFKYRVRSAGEPNDFRVVLSTNGINPADFTNELMALNSYTNVVYKDTAINLSAYTGGVYIAFHVPPGGLDGYYLYIDDVCIDICTPAAGTDGNIDVCRLDGTVDLNTVITQGETNGVWQFAPNQSAVNGSIVNVSAIPDGTFEMNYIVTTACTIDTTVATLTIHPASSAGTNGQVNVCKNQPFNLLAGLTGLVDLGGTWYDPSNTALPSGQITSGALPGQFNYNYITNNGFCPNDTATVIVNISATCDWSGLEELNADAITVYPNPSTGLFYIANTDASQNFNYQVVDLNGRVIVENKVEINGSTTIEVDLTKVETGIYMIRLYNTYGSKLVRVVKQ